MFGKEKKKDILNNRDFFSLQKFPDLRFKYVEEESPEDFFVPYVWSLLKRKIYWNPDELSLKSGAFLET